MLIAILDGKGRTVPDGLKGGDSLRKVFKVSEDLLTATVFERLAYLKGATLWAILRATFRPDILPPRSVATLDAIEFWPRWSKANPTLEQDVEPDVVMRFTVGDPAVTATVIVECKLRDWQRADQWRKEWIAHETEFSGDDGPEMCFFLALGGLGRFAGRPQDLVAAFTEAASAGASSIIRATAADWSDLLHALHAVKIEDGPQRRVVEDLRQALALHGYRRVRPLADLASEGGPRGVSFVRSAAVLRPIHPEARLIEEAGPVDELADWPARTASFRPLTTWPETLRFRSINAHA